MIAIIGWTLLAIVIGLIGLAALVSLALFGWRLWLSKLKIGLQACAQCGRGFSVHGPENWIFCAQCLDYYCGEHRHHAGHGKKKERGDGLS